MKSWARTRRAVTDGVPHRYAAISLSLSAPAGGGGCGSDFLSHSSLQQRKGACSCNLPTDRCAIHFPRSRRDLSIVDDYPLSVAEKSATNLPPGCETTRRHRHSHPLLTWCAEGRREGSGSSARCATSASASLPVWRPTSDTSLARGCVASASGAGSPTAMAYTRAPSAQTSALPE